MVDDERPCERCRSVRLRKLWLWAGGFAVAAVLLAVFVGWTAHRLAGYVDENRAYRDARPCPVGEPAPRDCLRDVSAVVRTVIDLNGRSPKHALYLSGEELSFRSVRVSGSGPMMKHVDRGDTVVVTLWRDRVVALRAGTHVEATRDTPYNDASSAVMFIAAGTPVVPLFLRFAVWVPRNRHAIADKRLIPTLDAWRRPDIALAAAAASTLVTRAIAALLDVGASLTAQSLTAAISATTVFAVVWYAFPHLKWRPGRPSARH